MNKYSVHPSSIVDTSDIGENTTIWAFVHILNAVKIGSNVNICDHCFIEQNVVIGDDVTIKCGVWLWDGVIVENNVFVGPNVTFTNDRYPRSKNIKFDKKGTLLKLGCSIGANATLLAGLTVGSYAMVGAGSVVTKDVPDYAMIYGNPAKIEDYACRCGKKLLFNSALSSCSCGLKYRLDNEQVICIA